MPLLQQLADDRLDIAARTEATPLAGDNDRFHLVAIRQRREQVAQLGVDLEGQRIQPIRPGERDRRDPAVFAVAERCWLSARELSYVKGLRR